MLKAVRYKQWNMRIVSEQQAIEKNSGRLQPPLTDRHRSGMHW
jgi:hypothetical protein